MPPSAPKPLAIRRAVPEDAEILSEFLREIYVETYKDHVEGGGEAIKKHFWPLVEVEKLRVLLGEAGDGGHEGEGGAGAGAGAGEGGEGGEVVWLAVEREGEEPRGGDTSDPGGKEGQVENGQGQVGIGQEEDVSCGRVVGMVQVRYEPLPAGTIRYDPDGRNGASAGGYGQADQGREGLNGLRGGDVAADEGENEVGGDGEDGKDAEDGVFYFPSALEALTTPAPASDSTSTSTPSSTLHTTSTALSDSLDTTSTLRLITFSPIRYVARLYVHASRHGTGLARHLVDLAELEARPGLVSNPTDTLPADSMTSSAPPSDRHPVGRGAMSALLNGTWLKVLSNNERAVRFYNKIGYVVVAEEIVKGGWAARRDLVLFKPEGGLVQSQAERV